MDSPPRDPFERIYRRYVGDVYRFALAVLRNPAEAEDVTQTTFLNAYRAFERGDRPKRVNSWLIAIAHNAIRSRHRWSLRRPKEVPLDEAIHALAMPDEDQATVREVLEVLGQLPETQRTALAMRELEGRSYPEIAQAMGVTVSAVESMIARARRTLRAKHQSLRGLTLVQLPRSLRTFLEQGDTAGSGLMVKAAVVLAAAGAFAGGAAVTSQSAGASKKPVRAAKPEPSRALVARATTELHRPGGVVTGRDVPTVHTAAHDPARPAKAVPPAPATPIPPGGAPAAGGTTTPPGRGGSGTTGTSTVETPTGTVAYTSPRPPTVPTLPTAPTLPSLPSSLDPTTWQPPAPPELPTLPEPPTPPSAPQVSVPGGIK
jgi:RNA polymerase sigma factor (sigma-70 family)